MTLPPVPDAFRWTDAPWGAALRCVPLEAIAPHLFTSRLRDSGASAFAPGASADRWAGQARQLQLSLGASHLEMLKQVHGRDVVVVRHGEERRGQPAEGDALISNDPGVAVAVRAADCVPLLMADRSRGVVAAVHAGWRGAVARVAVAALEALGREFGTQPRDIVAAIGPCIGACCYEVGSELVDAFAAAGHERYLIDRWFVAPPPPQGAFNAPKPRLHLDVAGSTRDQLILAGVNEPDIHVAGLCTAMHLDVLTSFRAEKEKAGRIAGAIRCAARPS